MTILTSAAQFFYKAGANRLEFDLNSIITNYHIIFGLVLYGTGAILMLIALRYGEVSVLFPIIATSYIWVSLGGKYFFNEPIGIIKWIGISVVILGVSILGYGSQKGSVKYTGVV